MSAAFQYSEALFADQTGLTRGEARFHRDNFLREDVDWKKNGGGEIAWSASAVKRVWRRLAGRPASFDLSRCLIAALHEKNGAGEKNSAPILLGSKTQPIPREMIVLLIPLNPRVIRARDEHGEVHTVWVGNNSTFVVRDKIQVAPHETEQGIWRILGPLPRDRRRVNQ